MRTPPSLRRTVQLVLFQSVPKAPRWEHLPWEVRHQTLRLLARMLSEHGTRTLASESMRETEDE
ncbi:MAG: hypothetical protein ABI580_14240 [Burkholderiaceae bacterium]